MTPPLPRASLIVPCRNEAGYIGPCLESLLELDYPADALEILVVDGMSEDGTADVVRRFAAGAPWIRLIENPARITSAALNLGVIAATGDVILLIGAHSTYPTHYVRRLVEHLRRSGADAVGGTCTTKPGTDSQAGHAIAVAMSHPFGVGDSHFRLGLVEPRWVDTVPFGCYRRDVFERFGLFDEELVRNQDDEFNLRLLKGGGRLLLVPDVTSSYYARGSFPLLGRMFYQYGYYKPLVAQKLGRIMTLRQLAPATFVGALVGSGLLAPWNRFAALLLAIVLVAYVTADLLASLTGRPKACSRLYLAVAFPVMHFSYGIGFLIGALTGAAKLRRRHAATVPLSR